MAFFLTGRPISWDFTLAKDCLGSLNSFFIVIEDKAPILSLLATIDFLLSSMVEEYLSDNLLSRDNLFYLLESMDLFFINCLLLLLILF